MSHFNEQLQRLATDFPDLIITSTSTGFELVIPSARPIFQEIYIYLVWENTASFPKSARAAYVVKDNLPGLSMVERQSVEFDEADSGLALYNFVKEQVQNCQPRTGFQKLRDSIMAWW